MSNLNVVVIRLGENMGSMQAGSKQRSNPALPAANVAQSFLQSF